MGHSLTSSQRTFGEEAGTTTVPLPKVTRRMNKRRQDSMTNESVRENTAATPLKSSRPREEPTATVIYKRIATIMAEKYSKPNSKTINWQIYRFGFSLLRSVITSLRGSRSAFYRTAYKTDNLDLACSEGHVPMDH